MYLYRAVDEHGQLVDVLLREQRDLASAHAFFAQAILRRGVRPLLVVTDKHPAYQRAIRRHARRARHVRTGLHRACGETTKPMSFRCAAPERSGLRPISTTSRLRGISARRLPSCTSTALCAGLDADVVLPSSASMQAGWYELGAPSGAPRTRSRAPKQSGRSRQWRGRG